MINKNKSTIFTKALVIDEFKKIMEWMKETARYCR